MFRFNGSLTILLAATLINACQSSGPRGPVCKLHLGMTTTQLMGCGCQMTSSGGAGIVSGNPGGPGRAVTVSEFVCPAGKAGLAGVAVVDGVVTEVLY